MNDINTNGFTLIEVIVSIVLLGVISIYVLPLIGDSVVKIIESGEHDQAINTASNFTELVHQEVIINKELEESDWEEFNNKSIYYKDELVTIDYQSSGNINTNQNENKILFSKNKVNGGYKLQVIFFYNNGDNNIKINSFVSFKRG